MSLRSLIDKAKASLAKDKLRDVGKKKKRKKPKRAKRRASSSSSRPTRVHVRGHYAKRPAKKRAKRKGKKRKGGKKKR